MPRKALKYVFDIKAAAERVQRFVATKTEADYMADELLQSAVERQFEIIGEAMSQLHKTDSDMAEGITDYRKMIAFRNVLIHGYATIDPLIVWGVIESNLASLIEQVTVILESA
ncbi:antitoxin [Streptosporangium jomthongense]|nr:antitoxin [Streptosporangium jomthongense]